MSLPSAVRSSAKPLELGLLQGLQVLLHVLGDALPA